MCMYCKVNNLQDYVCTVTVVTFCQICCISFFIRLSFKSIGFLEYDNRRFRTLLVTLVPPAVFIAVMAMQLRYFRPRSSAATAGDQVESQAAIDIYSFLPKVFRDTLSKLNEGDIEEDSDEEVNG